MGIAIHKVVRRSNLNEPFNSSALNFTHGVASGDPYPHSVILVSGKSIQWNGNETDIRSGRDALRCMMIITVMVRIHTLAKLVCRLTGYSYGYRHSSGLQS
jgi:phosphodiesterase/alkaline phosphatase D-like protein